MKTCLIYGQNGLDLDVTFNLVTFYKKIGFRTVFSEKLYDSDILVVLRAINKPINLTNFHFSQIHVFDYGGWEYDEFINSVNHEITFIFTTCEKKKERLIDFLRFPRDHVFIALPPIETSLWISKKRKKIYDFVHIGNYKKIQDEDQVRKKFITSINQLNTDVWGLGWTLTDKTKYHGKAGLWDVSDIYSSSNFALGLMYPFQREVTISGRFWHAPLNGCYLFSEPGKYTSIIPGVIETDYNPDNIINISKNIKTKNTLKEEAKNFWDQQNAELVELINTILNTSNKHYKINNLLIFYLIFLNKTRFYYQKYRLFRLFTSKLIK